MDLHFGEEEKRNDSHAHSSTKEKLNDLVNSENGAIDESEGKQVS